MYECISFRTILAPFGISAMRDMEYGCVISINKNEQNYTKIKLESNAFPVTRDEKNVRKTAEKIEEKIVDNGEYSCQKSNHYQNQINLSWQRRLEILRIFHTI